MIMLLAIVWWVILLAGLIPAAYLLVTYRPARWRGAPAVIIRGLVGVVFLSYLRPVVSLAVAGGMPIWRGGWFQVTWSYVMCAATDVIVLLLLRLVLRYRKAYVRQMREDRS